MKRREFITGLSASVVGLTAAPALAVTVKPESVQQASPTDLIVDRRYLESTDQIPEHWLQATAIHPIDTGMSMPFLQTLQASWKRGSGMTAGITLSAEFFVLKTLAAEQGYQLSAEKKVGELVFWQLSPGINTKERV